MALLKTALSAALLLAHLSAFAQAEQVSQRQFLSVVTGQQSEMMAQSNTRDKLIVWEQTLKILEELLHSPQRHGTNHKLKLTLSYLTSLNIDTRNFRSSDCEQYHTHLENQILEPSQGYPEPERIAFDFLSILCPLR